jgi:hypothetical protein
MSFRIGRDDSQDCARGGRTIGRGFDLLVCDLAATHDTVMGEIRFRPRSDRSHRRFAKVLNLLK